MNNSGYLILIAALIVLTAFMLYARFAARSREKSVHHAPADSGVLRFEERAEISEILQETAQSFPDPIVMDLKPFRNELDEAKEKEKPAKVEDTYFDELQEAAAGLAMLMRSSPTQQRSQPVVFETEESESGEITGDDSPVVDLEEELVSSEIVEEEITAVIADTKKLVAEVEEMSVETSSELVIEEVSPTESEELVSGEGDSMGEAMDKVEALLDGPPVFSGEEESAFVADESNLDVGKDRLEMVLGEKVAAQLVAIDSGLDELESLVVSIEDQLALLEDFITAPLEADVSRAA